MSYGKQKTLIGINKLIIIKTETMGNRKEEIEDLKNEISRKQQTLYQLEEAEENDEQEQTIEPNKEDIEDFLRNI